MDVSIYTVISTKTNKKKGTKDIYLDILSRLKKLKENVSPN